jgi:hypothetical protein
MKSWNLLDSFEQFTPNVLSSVGKDASAEVPSSMKRRAPRQMRSTAIGVAVGAVVLVAVIGVKPTQVTVSGSGDTLHITATASTSNAEVDRPPLSLLFGGRHPLKWTPDREKEMLAKAASALMASDGRDNEANMIHAVLREGLPRNRKEADDLDSLGIRLG